MTLIWFSPRVPVDRAAIASNMGVGADISSAEFPPAGTAVAVATIFERPLLDRLAAVPGAGALLLLKPPGAATPLDLPPASGPSSVVEAADVGEVVAGITGMLSGAPALWPATDASTEAGPSGWLIAPAQEGRVPPTGEELASSPDGVRAARSPRRQWLATGGIVGAAALAAVVVLATQGGASNTSADGFRGGPGGAAGYGGLGGVPGGGLSGGYGLPGTGGSGTTPNGRSDTSRVPGSADGSGQDGDGTTKPAPQQAFLDCLQKNGINTSALMQSGPPRLDPSDPTMATALQACSSLMPQRGGHDDDGGGTPGMPPGGGPMGAGAGSAQSGPARTT